MIFLQHLLIVAGEPKNNMINLSFYAALLFSFCNIMWINTGKRHSINAGIIVHIQIIYAEFLLALIFPNNERITSFS